MKLVSVANNRSMQVIEGRMLDYSHYHKIYKAPKRRVRDEEGGGGGGDWKKMRLEFYLYIICDEDREQWDIHDNHTDLISLIHRLMCDMKIVAISFIYFFR